MRKSITLTFAVMITAICMAQSAKDACTSVEELSRRLHGRGTETEELIQKRLAKAEYEMSFAQQFDHIVVNDNLDKAVSEIENILK